MNNGGLATWSKTAAANAGADSTINYAEGQAPSSLNDSARALMASAAKWRDDIAGALVTTGTSAAYAVSSNQNFVNITDFANQVIAFTPHVTNAAGPVTLTVDGFANIPLRTAPNTELMAGVLVQGTPYVATYNNTDHALYLQSFYGASPYLIPLGAMLDFTGSTAPNSNFVLPFGQAISRTTYATYFAMVGTAYGGGDGTTTFNIPDLRGRVTAAPDGMGGTLAGRLDATSGMNGVGIGAVGGAQTHTLTATEIPSHQHSVYLKDPGHAHSVPARSAETAGHQYNGGASGVDTVGSTGAATTGITIGSVNGVANDNLTASVGGGGAHAIIQPTIVVNKILRVI